MNYAGALKAAGEAADVDLEPSISAKHRIAGIAVTWDAEHIYFLPASAGVQTGHPSRRAPLSGVLCGHP